MPGAYPENSDASVEERHKHTPFMVLPEVNDMKARLPQLFFTQPAGCWNKIDIEVLERLTKPSGIMEYFRGLSKLFFARTIAGAIWFMLYFGFPNSKPYNVPYDFVLFIDKLLKYENTKACRELVIMSLYYIDKLVQRGETPANKYFFKEMRALKGERLLVISALSLMDKYLEE